MTRPVSCTLRQLALAEVPLQRPKALTHGQDLGHVDRLDQRFVRSQRCRPCGLGDNGGAAARRWGLPHLSEGSYAGEDATFCPTQRQTQKLLSFIHALQVSVRGQRDAFWDHARKPSGIVPQVDACDVLQRTRARDDSLVDVEPKNALVVFALVAPRFFRDDLTGGGRHRCHRAALNRGHLIAILLEGPHEAIKPALTGFDILSLMALAVVFRHQRLVVALLGSLHGGGVPLQPPTKQGMADAPRVYGELRHGLLRKLVVRQLCGAGHFIADEPQEVAVLAGDLELAPSGALDRRRPVDAIDNLKRPLGLVVVAVVVRLSVRALGGVETCLSQLLTNLRLLLLGPVFRPHMEVVRERGGAAP